MSFNFYKNLRKGYLSLVLVLLAGFAFSQGLTGVYTVDPLGTGNNYTTLKEAIDSLNSKGVGTGGVTFNVVAGFTETAPVGGYQITATGTSANPIIIKKSGSGANPLLTAYVGGTGAPNAASPAPDGIFRLVGSDYVTIDGIDLTENAANTANPATMEYGYGLFKKSKFDGCQNVTIQNCSITLNRINFASGTAPMVDGSVGIFSTNSKPDSATTNLVVTTRSGTNSYNRFYSNTIKNVNIGIALIGYAASSPYLGADTLNDIGGGESTKGNTIINFGGGASATNPAAGIRTLAQYGLSIANNIVNNNNGSGVNHVSTLRGIYVNTAASASASISNNNVLLSGGAAGSQISGIENVSGGSGSNNQILISNNKVAISSSTATSASVYGIYNQSSPSVLNIFNNSIDSIRLTNSTSTATVYGIHNSGSAVTVNVKNNSVKNINKVAIGSGTTIGIYISSGTNQNIKNNIIDGINVTGASGVGGTTYGIQASATTVVVDSNTVTNINLSKTTATAVLYGIYNVSSPNNENYNYNTISNLNNLGTGNTYGFTANTVSGVRKFSFNTIYNITSNGTTVAGMSHTTSSPSIFNNTVYNIVSTNPAAPVVSGIQITSVGSSGVATVYNNVISDIKAPSATIAAAPVGAYVRGINITASTSNSNFNIYNNTVYLTATSSGSNFGTAALFHTVSTTATTARLNLIGNILIDKSTPKGAGVSAAFRTSGTGIANYGSTSNSNLFYAGTPSATNAIFYDGTNVDQNLVNFTTRVAPMDKYSVTEDVAFVDPLLRNFHIPAGTASKAESGTIKLAVVTHDMDGNVRPGPAGSTFGGAVSPDIGADEFDGVPQFPFGDILPPSFVLDSVSPKFNSCLTTGHVFYATISDLQSTIDTAIVQWTLGSSNAVQTPINFVHTTGNKYQATIATYLDSSINYSFRIVDASVNKNVLTVPGGSYIDASYNVVPIVNQTSVTAGTVINLYASTPKTGKIGSGTASNGTNVVGGAAYASYYGNGRQQFLIRASELKAMGVPAGVVKSVGFNVTGLATGADTLLKAYTIKMGSTTANSISTLMTSGLVTVYPATDYKPVMGMNTHTLNNSFTWDGQSNVIIDICFENGITGNASALTEWTTGLPFTSSVYYQVDGATAACGSTSQSGTATSRPNIYFTTQANVTTATWSQTSGGGLGATNTINTTATPLVAGTYTYTLNASNGICSSTNSIDITVLNPAAPIANFSISNNTPTTGGNTQTVILTDLSQNLPSAWEWTITPNTYSFVNSTNKNSQNPAVTFSATGLYSIKLKASNITGVDSITKVDSINVVPGYCVTSLHSTSSNCIDTVLFGTLLNATGASGCALPSYSLQTATATIEKATPTPIRVTTGANNSVMSVWIDYNHDGNLSANEHTQLATSAPVGTAVIYIPPTAKSGLTRMRVRTRSTGSSNGPNDACTTFGSGETEDYDIMIVTPAGDFWPPDFSNVAINPPSGQCAPTAHTVSVTITDTTGVDSAWVVWSVNGVSRTNILMTNVGSTYSGVIPATPAGSTVAYSFIAKDSSPRKNAGNFNGGNYSDATFNVQATPSSDSIVIGNTVSFSVEVFPKPVIGTGTSTKTGVPNPYYTTFWGNKEQFLIRASELTAAGYVAGQLTSLGLAVGSATTTLPLTDFKISIGHTTSSVMTTSFATGLTQVYSSPSYTVLPNQVNTHVFSTPFVWDGVSNIIIETCFNNSNWNGSQTISYTTTSYQSCTYFYDDITTVCATGTGLNTSADRPNFIIGQPSSVAFTWSSNLPTAGLSATNIANPTATPTAVGNYEFYATGNNGTCSFTDTVKVKVITPTKPVADFGVDKRVAFTNTKVTFSDSTKNLPDSIRWVFTPNTVTYLNSTNNKSKNPEVSFANGGLYSVKLIAENLGGKDSITKVGYIQIINTYCPSAAANIGDEDIGRVRIGAFANNSPGALPSSNNTNANKTYSDLLGVVGFKAGIAVEDTMEVSLINSGGTYYASQISAWIDLNQDGTFDPVNERIFSELSTANANDRTKKAPFTIPVGSKVGYSVMRVITWETGFTPGTGPCGSYGYGETEDYLIQILPPPPGDYYPPDVSNIQITPAGGSCNPVPHVISATVTDTTAVDSVWLTWTIDGVPQPDVVMSNVGSTYSATIPAAGSSRIAFGFRARDLSTIHVNTGIYTGGSYQDASLKARLNLGADAYIPVGGSKQLDGAIKNARKIGYGTAITTGSTSPYYTTWWGNKIQYILKASELIDQGVVPGQITSIGLSVGSVSTTLALTDFTISMGHTTLNDLSTTFVTTLSPVYYNAAYVIQPNQDNTHVLNTPFIWDGVSNVIIETCFNNSAYNGSQQVTYSTTPFTSVAYFNDDASNVCGSITAEAVSSTRPNFLIGQPFSATYSWTQSANGGLSSTTISNPVATPTAGVGAYEYIVTANDGTCSALDTIIVNVLTNPVVNIGGPTGIICGTNAKVLDAGNPGSTYVWTLDNVPYATTQTVNATAIGLYKVVVTNQAGLSSSDTIRLTQGPALTLTVADRTICAGGSIVINPGTYNSYLWSTGATTPTITVSQAGQYILTVTNVEGCVATDTFDVTVVQPPSFNLGADRTVCSNGSITIDAGNVGSTYLWSTGATTQSISVNSAGSYSVIVTTSSGCTLMDTVNVTVTPAPVVNLGPNQQICPGSSAQLNAGNSGATYLWSTGATTQSISVTTAGTYIVTVSSGGCSAKDTVVVTLKAAPTVSLGPDLSICTNDTATLDAGNIGSTYLWSTGATTRTIKVSAAGTYTVTVTNAEGCTGTDAVVVTNKPAPNAGFTTTAQVGTSVTFQATSTVGLSYLWNFGDPNSAANTSQAQSPIHVFTGAGTYTVTLTVTSLANLCSATSTQQIVISGVGNNLAELFKLGAAPNPFVAETKINYTLPEDANSVSVEVYDMIGRKVADIVNNEYQAAGNYQFNYRNEDMQTSSGVYMVRLTVDGKVAYVRIIDIAKK